MRIPIDVIATFNTLGKIKPNYIRLEDEEHQLRTFRVEQVEYTKEEKWAGIPVMVFLCDIITGGLKKQITLFYYREQHKWMIDGGGHIK